MTRCYETVDDSIIDQLAKQARIGTSGIRASGGTRLDPYCAIYDIAVPGCIAPGHPYQLLATGATPQQAVESLTNMIAIWYEDPTSARLEAEDGGFGGERRALGLARSASPPASAKTPSPPRRVG